MGRLKTIGIIGIALAICFFSYLSWLAYTSDVGYPHSYYLIGVGPHPSSHWKYYTHSDDPELDDSLRGELANTTFVLVFEIKQVNFTSEVRYEYHSSSGWISVTNGGPAYFEEWEYGTTYEFTIRFLPLTNNVTIRALSLFSEERYINGTFQVTKDENRDVVTYATYQGEQINEGREPKYNYYGSTSDALYGDAALTVQLVEWATQE